MKWIKKVATKHNEWLKIAYSLGGGSYSEDIVQEVYIRLFKYSSKEKVLNKHNKIHRGYMYSIIRNVVYDYLRKSSKVIKIPLNEFYNKEVKDLTDSEYNKKLISSDNLEEQNAYWELCKKMDQELETWDWYDRKIFEIYRDKKISIRQLAKETNISWVNIFYTLKRGKQKMKEKFGEDYEDLINKDYDRL